MRVPRAKLLPLLVFAVAVTLAHVCALPGHTHAAPAVADDHAHADARHHHDDGHAEGSLDATSCDVLRPASAVPAPPVLAVGPAGVMPARPSVHAGDGAVAAAPRASPPLYLAHRALLI
jgi:hypothetical protein